MRDCQETMICEGEILFDLEAFDLYARRNLEFAAERLTTLAASHRGIWDLEKTPGDLQLHVAYARAAATIRELLKLPEGRYGDAT